LRKQTLKKEQPMIHRVLKNLVLFALAISPALSQQSQTPATGRILTPTRLVATFSEKENAWAAAVQKKSSSVLDQFLDDEFQVWNPDQPGATPREDWQKTAFSNPPTSFQIQHMAARPVRDDVTIVSFVIHESRAQQTTQSFVIDVWTKSGGDWRCTDRYVSRMPRSTHVPTRPTGRN
jgi:uncharacterized protein DUF4440